MSEVLSKLDLDRYGNPYPYQCSFLHFQKLPEDSFTLWSFYGEIVYAPKRWNEVLGMEEEAAISALNKVHGYTFFRLQ